MFFKLPPGVVEIDPTFISDGTLDKMPLREHLSYWLWRAKCWIEMRKNA